MVPLMVVSLPAGALADRLSKRSVIVAMKALEVALMLAGTAVLRAYPTGGLPALVILGLLGVQAALFSPAKYGLLPEILPHERLSSGNGLLELWNNLAILAGIVAGGELLGLTAGKPWLAGLVLSTLSVLGLLAALTIPHVPAARSKGGVVETVQARLVGDPQRPHPQPGDPGPDPRLGGRQPCASGRSFVRQQSPWGSTRGSANHPLACARARDRSGQPRRGQALGLEGRVRAPPPGRPGPVAHHTGLCADRSRAAGGRS